jgi:aerotolerance regulator-like protein
MMWIYPAAWFALIVLAAPIVIHLLAHRRAAPLAFPTLRFIRPTRLAAIRRRALEDLPLLIVRVAILASAVAALAGPLLVTPARRASWNARLVRAIVTSPASMTAGVPSHRADANVFRSERFAADALPDGIHRAVAWLENAPPARRELVIAAPLTLGSIDARDLAAVPTTIGVRFERASTQPSVRTVAAGAVMNEQEQRRRTIRVATSGTTVSDSAEPDVRPTPPVDIIAGAEQRRRLQAALAAVLSQWIAAPPTDHRAELIVAGAGGPSETDAVSPIRTPWVADAAARISQDLDLRAEAARVKSGFAEPTFLRSPWQPLVGAADGRPVVVAAASRTSQLVVIVPAEITSEAIAPVLLRAVAASLSPPNDPRSAEVIPISDAQLRAWTREPAPWTVPRLDTVDRDDRRWVWAFVLVLIAAETVMRRTRSRSEREDGKDEVARVA